MSKYVYSSYLMVNVIRDRFTILDIFTPILVLTGYHFIMGLQPRVLLSQVGYVIHAVLKQALVEVELLQSLGKPLNGTLTTELQLGHLTGRCFQPLEERFAENEKI